jgi:hypothetical protein
MRPVFFDTQHCFEIQKGRQSPIGGGADALHVLSLDTANVTGRRTDGIGFNAYCIGHPIHKQANLLAMPFDDKYPAVGAGLNMGHIQFYPQIENSGNSPAQIHYAQHPRRRMMDRSDVPNPHHFLQLRRIYAECGVAQKERGYEHAVVSRVELFIWHEMPLFR